MPDLFGVVDRTERQEESVQKWVNNKLRGTLVLPTGFGKTRCGLRAISRFLNKNPSRKVLVVVPSDPIKIQWISELAKWNLNADVVTIGIASKTEMSCDMLVLDEIHKYAAPQAFKMFTNVKYKIILGLTATFNRVDGRDALIAEHAPVIDTISLQEAIQNNWLSKYVEYKVLIEVDDIEDYRKIDREFQEHYSYFNRDFNLAMNCHTDWKIRYQLAKERAVNPDKVTEINRQIIQHAAGFNRTLQARKKFIYYHPKKLEIANLILEHRQDKKCITFSSVVAVADKIKYGKTYSGRDTGKNGKAVLEEFKAKKTGVLNTVMRLNEGFNDPSISVGIFLGFNSSANASKQRLGRIIRLSNEHGVKEVFTLVLRHTQDEIWFDKSTSGRDYITIDERELINVLEGKEFTPMINKKSSIMFTA